VIVSRKNDLRHDRKFIRITVRNLEKIGTTEKLSLTWRLDGSLVLWKKASVRILEHPDIFLIAYFLQYLHESRFSEIT